MPSPTPPLPDVPIGARVVVRYLIEDGERATDAVGELVARDADALTVETRRGPVRITHADIVVSKPIRPAPGRWRVASFLRRGSVAVLDLDGVLRTHDTGGALATAEAELGLSAGALIQTALSLPEATSALQGELPYAAWADALRVRLVADGHAAEAARAAVALWSSDHGTPVTQTVALVDHLRADGIPVLIFTNGTDRLPLELTSCGLGELTPALLNSADLGAAKPSQEAYAAAHAEIERRLGRTVGRGEVHFTDDRPANVDAARVFGWQATVFTLP